MTFPRGDIRLRLRSLARAARRLRADSQGLAAVEFALVLPILLTLWIGGVEVTQALSVDRRVNNIASMIGDLTSREKCVSDTNINDMFVLADEAMFPYSATPLSVRLTAIWIDENRNVTLDWSYAHGTKAKRTSLPDNFLPNLIKDQTDDEERAASTQIIVAESYYSFEPALGYQITGEIEFEQTLYFTPRLTARIKKDNC